MNTIQPYLILHQNDKGEWKTSMFWDYNRFMVNVQFMLSNPQDYKNVTTYKIWHLPKEV